MGFRFFSQVPIAFALLAGSPAKAFTDGPILIQILAEKIKQLVELQRMVADGKNSLELARDINRGINDSLRLLGTVGPRDPGIFGDLASKPEIAAKLAEIFGKAAVSPDQGAQETVDKTVAEAIAMDNAIFAYSREIDRIGEDIKAFSHETSPGGAAKLTAQSLGVMIHVLSQSLRAQGEIMKLQAQGLAAANKRDKDYSANFVKTSSTLTSALKASAPAFSLPRL